MIDVQGRLTDRDGRAIKTPVRITASFYAVPSGGVPLLPGITSEVFPDNEGVFNLHLGKGIPGGVGLDFTEDDYYLGLQVGADSEMTPRHRLVSVPFAVTAKNVRGGTVAASVLTAGRAAVSGRAGLFGILGESTDIASGTGVRGISRGSDPLYAIGVYGGSRMVGVAGGGITTLETADTGVKGEGRSRGVLGTSEAGVGVFGWGRTAGGSFESANGYGMYAKTSAGGYKGAVKAESTEPGTAEAVAADITNKDNTASCIYAHTKGSGAGVFGLSGQGPGIQGYSPIAAGYFEGYETGTAIYAINNGVGPVLQIGPSGWLKMPIGRVTWRPEGYGTDTTPSTTEVWINSNVGVIEYIGVWGRSAPPGFSMTVHCDRVKSSGAAIIASVISGINNTRTADINSPAGTFKVWCASGEDIAFIVINP
jgi:hypothetical protein